MRHRKLALGIAGFICCALAVTAAAQVSDKEIADLQAQGVAEGWTFDVVKNSATEREMHVFPGLIIPENWGSKSNVVEMGEKGPLPSSFNWEDHVGMPPIRDQGSCNSCWAFAMIGTLETHILMKDSTVVNLSEQWLVSCNQETVPPTLPSNDPTPSWGCNGGWLDFDYFTGAKTDPCGHSGAVLEADFPYVANKVACGCPYPHSYMLDSWAFIGPEFAEASVDAIKQAIVEHGPVASGVYASVSFSAYGGGVYNADSANAPNHSVVIIGWDDNLGANGAWRIRNGWGGDWGDSGYMWIGYGVASIGFGACYVDYPGIAPASGPTIVKHPTSASVGEGFTHTFIAEADGLGLVQYEWYKDGDSLNEFGPQFRINTVSLDDVGAYTCYISDVNGTVISNAANLTIDPTATIPATNWTTIVGLIAITLTIGLFALKHRTHTN